MYVSLSELQIQEEEDASNRPFTKVMRSWSNRNLFGLRLEYLSEALGFFPSNHFCFWVILFVLQGNVKVPFNAVEQLYEAMLPNLPQYMVRVWKTFYVA